MAAFTSIGPIGVRQMNSNLYVGQNDLTTIQAAVTAAAQMGGVFTVYIPPEYAGTDSPTAVTGGNSSIYLMDERNGQRQSYLWYNGAFVKEPILAAGVATPQLNHYIYVGIEGQWPTIQSAVDNAVSGGLGDFVIITTSYSGSENIGSLTGGAANVFIVDERTAQRQVYEWNGTNYIPSDFEPLGAIRANLITANDLSVTDASFDTATVADSPVRTFANTPDGPGQGMVWPPEGIPVSLGSTWQMPSIDPDDLATWPAAGIAVSTGSAWGTPINPNSVPTWPASGIPVSTGTAWGTSIAPAALATWPAAGIAVSTGSAWGTPINPNSVPTWPASGIPVSTGTAWGTSIAPAALATWPASGIPVSTGTAWGTPINPANVALLNQANVFTQVTTVASLASNSSMTAAGQIISSGANGLLQAGDLSANSANAEVGQPRINLGVNGQNGVSYPGYFQLSTWASSTTSSSHILSITHYAADIGASGNLFLLSLSGLYIPGVVQSGSLSVSGNKNFRISHPLDKTKDLVHSCLEGPENGLFYRGEAETIDGKAEITLPDYFEALAMGGHRTILLTELYEDENDPVFGNFLAAGRINNGKFVVRSSTPTVKFYWEVKAVRRDIPPLEVEPDKTKDVGNP